MEVDKNKLGLVAGGFAGIWQFVWILLVAGGAAQWLIDLVFRIHFIDPPYHIAPFGFGRALALLAVTMVGGYVAGWILAALWNWTHKV